MFGGQFYNKKYANSSCYDTASLLGAGANPLNINANIAKINESANFCNIYFRPYLRLCVHVVARLAQGAVIFAPWSEMLMAPLGMRLKIPTVAHSLAMTLQAERELKPKGLFDYLLKKLKN